MATARVIYKHTKSQTSELKLLQGDITAVHTDAVVTGESPGLEGVSAVTQALFQIYPKFITKREQLYKKEGNHFLESDLYLKMWNVYTTELGRHHPAIIHAVMDKGNTNEWLKLMRNLYSRVFSQAEKLAGVSVLALPVLGTGSPDSDRDLAVEALVLSLRAYTPDNVTSIFIVSPSIHLLELVEARYNHYLFNPEEKGSFFGSLFESVKRVITLPDYMDVTKMSEKRQQLKEKEERDLQKALALSQTESGAGRDRKQTSEDKDRDYDAAASSVPATGWMGDGISGRVMLGQSDEHINCPICLNPVEDPKQLDKCGHMFCRACIERSFLEYKPVCPSCNMVYGEIRGNQPDGQMDVGFSGEHLPGYESHGTITITYYFSSGTQGDKHPHPGDAYKGTTRRAFLPDTKKGRQVLSLLRKAFDLRLVFTIGRSSSTGQDDVITWNDIHHKTNKAGGPTRFGYPDPTYLQRVKDELASKGITVSKDK